MRAQKSNPKCSVAEFLSPLATCTALSVPINFPIFTELGGNFARFPPLAVRQSGLGRTHVEAVGQLVQPLACARKNIGNTSVLPVKQAVFAQIVRSVAQLTDVADTVALQIQELLGFLKQLPMAVSVVTAGCRPEP